MKKSVKAGLGFFCAVAFCLATGGIVHGQAGANVAKAKEFRIERSMPEAAIACIECHKQESQGIFADWAHSRHASAAITCLDCHQAESFDPDVSQEHYKQYERSDQKYGRSEFKVPVAAVVTPKDCSRCHPDEAWTTGGRHAPHVICPDPARCSPLTT